ncbi:beta-N-acetylhexosaminidase [Flavisolibacter nicotianae]|uniref:beta-N-acetylhexosaminidase n=1 Tax=Flavisolibacter nicotianae TaxID=2364882 RepID=UPI000EB08F93|nr:family 20 glycosylhydrolase [Flavisolibacter nicotianae]
MKKQFVLLLSAFTFIQSHAQGPKKEPAVIPEPVSLQQKAGTFTLPKTVSIEAPAGADLQTTVSFLKTHLSVPTGYNVTASSAAPNAAIRLQLNKSADDKLGKEGYRLSVSPKNIVLSANTPAGLFYGVQTLLQLFPKEIESAKAVSNVRWEVPAVEIMDYPRFGWRGLMFDVSRHFFTKEQVKQYIDQMVRYKYNLLHWHLTDDEGWRIEIKGLPNLTKVGAWNVKKEGYFGTFSPPAPDEPRNFGGFYTQDDIREVVQYAKERFVNILPEVDVPGHSLAAIVSYPELSCTEGADKYVVRSGEPIMDWSHGAPPIAMVDNTLCPANEKVYEFMDKVITQVAQLFPFEYIHLGGDEAPHNFWEKSEQVKALMQKEGLKTIPQVQEYFTRRVEKIVASKGKKLIGWDEILEGGALPKTTAVMSWRGMKGGIEAAKKGHEVVMSPTTFAYIDYMQGDPIVEPRIYATLRLSKAYQFDPLPEDVDKKYIKGGQANLWTEQVYNMRHAEYMTWPRGWAIAESLWSPKEKKNWKDFFGRVENHFQRSDVAQIKYAPSVYDPSFKASKDANGELKIELGKEVDDLDIYYTFDNSFPDNFYPKYKSPLTPPKDAVQLKVVTYKGDKQVGRIIAMPIEELKKRADNKRNVE